MKQSIVIGLTQEFLNFSYETIQFYKNRNSKADLRSSKGSLSFY
ncbi:hypothetical protein LEP1GSC008_1709 [Leptospira kirschneri serovar Bulgarica str. Nikolaevo]|uniref:Uncharacterized protein n=1 Tax=Leptospira kirschneri serovar Bulgarica str. Nikolaevo TaxID=1240687 RepID=M6F2K4_9LEPT|nr:hypothetical protein LEP1GSC008_1709 [Leptospira kirschneri serovar Bulgarica str. Nikolaevo]